MPVQVPLLRQTTLSWLEILLVLLPVALLPCWSFLLLGVQLAGVAQSGEKSGPALVNAGADHPRDVLWCHFAQQLAAMLSEVECEGRWKCFGGNLYNLRGR